MEILLCGTFDDLTRLVDGMRDDRLGQAVDAIESGAIDPVELRALGTVSFPYW
jgi:hypothetical protein